MRGNMSEIIPPIDVIVTTTTPCDYTDSVITTTTTTVMPNGTLCLSTNSISAFSDVSGCGGVVSEFVIGCCEEGKQIYYFIVLDNDASLFIESVSSSSGVSYYDGKIIRVTFKKISVIGEYNGKILVYDGNGQLFIINVILSVSGVLPDFNIKYGDEYGKNIEAFITYNYRQSSAKILFSIDNVSGGNVNFIASSNIPSVSVSPLGGQVSSTPLNIQAVINTSGFPPSSEEYKCIVSILPECCPNCDDTRSAKLSINILVNPEVTTTTTTLPLTKIYARQTGYMYLQGGPFDPDGRWAMGTGEPVAAVSEIDGWWVKSSDYIWYKQGNSDYSLRCYPLQNRLQWKMYVRNPYKSSTILSILRGGNWNVTLPGNGILGNYGEGGGWLGISFKMSLA